MKSIIDKSGLENKIILKKPSPDYLSINFIMKKKISTSSLFKKSREKRRAGG